MICTCTLNPSLDYYMEFDGPIETGSTNRSNLEYYEAGGKGINISIVLNNLQIPTRAYGFLGGFTREFYIMLLQKYEFIQPNFTYIDGHTRINVKMHNDRDTDLNAAGPYITSQNMQNLKDKVARLVEGDYFALAGVCPDYLTNEVVDMLKNAIENGVKVVLDTNAEVLEKVLPLKPFLVKTSQSELEEFVGHPFEDEQVVNAAKEIYNAGAENVLVLVHRKKAVLVCEQGNYECDILHGEKAVNTVGTGDSLTAGFLMNYMRSSDAIDSFRFAACCGSATAYSKGMATKEKIESFYNNTEVRKID